MEVHSVMSPSRTNNTVSNTLIRPRLMLCVLLVAVCLLAFPKRSAQTSVNLGAGRVAPASFQTAAAMIFTVMNTGDNGGINPAPNAMTGTLRQAIIDANANAGADTINFGIPGPADRKSVV